jgi:hypothetical protein
VVANPSHRSRTPGWQTRPMKVRAAARLIRQSRRHQRLHFRSSRPTDPCRSPKLRRTLNPVPVTMLQAAPNAIHFKRILNFGEGQGTSALLFCRKYCATSSQAWDMIKFFPVQAIFSISSSQSG